MFLIRPTIKVRIAAADGLTEQRTDVDATGAACEHRDERLQNRVALRLGHSGRYPKGQATCQHRTIELDCGPMFPLEAKTREATGGRGGGGIAASRIMRPTSQWMS